MKKFIAVAGNVAVGKTILTRRLCEHLLWEPFHSLVDNNPYLSDFYDDQHAWCFHSQMYFLSRRLGYHGQIVERPGTVVQDRTAYEDAEIWAKSFYEGGFMAERDWRTFWELYQTVMTILPPPDLLIYLHAPVAVLLDRIRRRGRTFERQITVDQLGRLDELYEAWVEEFRLCPTLRIAADDLDMLTTEAHLDLIAGRILDKLRGKETVVFD